MKMIYAIAIGLCVILIVPPTLLAEGERRYEATLVYNEPNESCVFILDTKVGYVWTWTQKKIDNQSYTTIQYWGMVEIGKKMGEVMGTTLPKRLLEKLNKNDMPK